MSSTTLRLEVRGLKKSYGATHALGGVDLSAHAGEVLAVLGENGAGKSTLMKVLSGAEHPDAGSLTLDGAPFRPRSPKEARAAGVSIVYQELCLCPHMTVLENVLLGDEPVKHGLLDRRESERRAEAALSAALGDARARFDLGDRVDTLTSADRQLVEISRALAAAEGCRVLILDEPTSSLAADDVSRLFGTVKRLAERGTTVLYVTHFLEELPRIARRFTVLRDGVTVGSGDLEGTSADALVAMMAGRSGGAAKGRAPRTPGAARLVVEGLAGVKKPERASFTLREGEVLGIAGLVGAGRTELCRALFGLDPVRGGTVKRTGSVGLLSEDRKGEGLLLTRPVEENVTLSRMPDFFVKPAWARAEATKWIAELSIKCAGPDARVSDLSGGNQQKVAIARLLHENVDVWLLDEPTRGIDVASRAEVHRVIGELAARGKAILVVSSHFPELLEIADRIAVMKRGILGEAKPAAAWTEADLLKEAAFAAV